MPTTIPQIMPSWIAEAPEIKKHTEAIRQQDERSREKTHHVLPPISEQEVHSEALQRHIDTLISGHYRWIEYLEALKELASCAQAEEPAA